MANRKAWWLCLGTAMLLGAVPGAKGQQVYEAEDVIVNREALVPEVLHKEKWSVWSTDPNKRQWSGGTVVRTPIVQQDRKTTEEGAPMVHVRLPILEAGVYTIALKGASRPLGLSLDGGKTWRKFVQGTIVESQELPAGHFDCWFDDRYETICNGRRGPAYLDAFMVHRLEVLLDGKRTLDIDEGTLANWRLVGREKQPDSLTVEVDSSSLRAKIADGASWSVEYGKLFKIQPGEDYKVTLQVKGELAESARLEVIGTVKGVRGRRPISWSSSFRSSKEWQQITCYATLTAEHDGLLFRLAGTGGAADIAITGIELERLHDYRGEAKPRVVGHARERIEEKLGRGVVAREVAEGVYVSWRLLKSDAKDTGFDVFRVVDGRETKLNASPIVQTCDFVDTAPVADAVYVVRGGSVPEGRSSVWKRGAGGAVYKSIKLKDPEARVQKVAVADLNGDGEYDFVVKTPAQNVDPWHVVWYRSPDTYKLEGYLHDGTHLWTHDLGWDIERGIWYSPYVVHDLDGDGRAEVVAKVSVGDHREEDGHVYDGPEEFVVWDGMTGREIARAPWVSREMFGKKGKDAYGFAARNQLTIAYLDGKTPCVICLRGTYAEMAAEAWQLKNGKLERLWTYRNDALPRRWYGQGAHTNYALDVDGDGRDEVVLGSAVIDDNGQPLWTTGKGHPDGVFFGKLVPWLEGLQVGYILETPQKTGGICMADGKTGKMLWELQTPTSHVDGKGTCADIDVLHPGVEIAGGDMNILVPGTNKRGLVAAWLMNAKGETLYEGKDMPYRFGTWTAYWDADLQKELLRNGLLYDHQGGPVTKEKIHGGPALVADILGDWREEIITSPVKGEVRIYTTPLPAMDRRVCLMQEHNYRMRQVSNAMGYATEALLPYDPESESPNFNVTCLQDASATRLQVVVVASRHQALKGTVELRGEGMTLSPASYGVDLQPGERQVQLVEVTDAGDKRGDKVFGEVRQDGQPTLRGQVLVRVASKMLEGGIQVEAEDFAEQRGGEVKKRSDKRGMRGQALSHWDAEGHALDWHFEVPEAGEYELVIRYCTPQMAKRRLLIDGKNYGIQALPATGGFGDAAFDWEHHTALSRNGAFRFKLSAGRHVVTLENVDKQGMNLDYLALMPVKR